MSEMNADSVWTQGKLATVYSALALAIVSTAAFRYYNAMEVERENDVFSQCQGKVESKQSELLKVLRQRQSAGVVDPSEIVSDDFNAAGSAIKYTCEVRLSGYLYNPLQYSVDRT